VGSASARKARGGQKHKSGTDAREMYQTADRIEADAAGTTFDVSNHDETSMTGLLDQSEAVFDRGLLKGARPVTQGQHR